MRGPSPDRAIQPYCSRHRTFGPQDVESGSGQAARGHEQGLRAPATARSPSRQPGLVRALPRRKRNPTVEYQHTTGWPFPAMYQRGRFLRVEGTPSATATRPLCAFSLFMRLPTAAGLWAAKESVRQRLRFLSTTSAMPIRPTPAGSGIAPPPGSTVMRSLAQSAA